MSELEDKQRNPKEILRKIVPRILKATIVTAVVGVFLLVFWLLISMLLAWYPAYTRLFAVLACATLFFTFATKVTDGTIYKYGFIITRALFLIVYLVYATNCGILTIDLKNFHFTAQFIPLLALMIMINLLNIAKGMIEAIEFTSESPIE